MYEQLYSQCVHDSRVPPRRKLDSHQGRMPTMRRRVHLLGGST